jgi:putative DNA primase/helicase
VKSKFYEDLIDSNSHLFAFSNKVFDFNTNTYRPIKPLDYIMTNTGYDFPEYVEDCDVKFLEEYFETLFPDTEKRNYVLDSSCITLNADRKEQFFNIHTGNGSNSKTTFNNLFESSLGGYACEISPETFTKPKKSANDTGELYKTKGKRAIFSNEPESDQDKLQTALLKRIADESGRKIIARALYCDPIEFKITFILNFFCNNKPELSSVDGGIARRLRIIDWKVKFVDEPDPNNVYQKPKNPDIMSKMRTDGVKNAFIRMLIDRWTNRVSQFKLIPVPQVVIDASNEYVDDSNPVLGFINENYELTNNTDDKVSSAVLYNHFTSYTNGTKISSKRFKDDLLGISGIETKRGNKGVVFTGLKKKEDEDDE